MCRATALNPCCPGCGPRCLATQAGRHQAHAVAVHQLQEIPSRLIHEGDARQVHRACPLRVLPRAVCQQCSNSRTHTPASRPSSCKRSEPWASCRVIFSIGFPFCPATVCARLVPGACWAYAGHAHGAGAMSHPPPRAVYTCRPDRDRQRGCLEAPSRCAPPPHQGVLTRQRCGRLLREPDELVQDVQQQRTAGRPEPEQAWRPEAISCQAYDRGLHGIDAVPLDRLVCQAWKCCAQRLEAAGVGWWLPGGSQLLPRGRAAGRRSSEEATRGRTVSAHRRGSTVLARHPAAALRVALAGRQETREERLDQGLFRGEMV